MRLTPHPNFSHDGAASASETDHDDAGAEAPLALAASDAVPQCTPAHVLAAHPFAW